jgi:hypothetical protein
LPTATHAEDEVHDTRASELLVAPDGLGVGWLDQALPVEASASASCLPERPV